MYADLDEASEEEVERVFKARYHIFTDPATMTARNFNLQPETVYMYRIAAVNDAGIGAWSNVITATTLAAPVAPGMPTAVMAEVVSDTHIRVSWTAPDNGGSDITGYDIEYTAAGGTAMMMEDCCTDLDGNLDATDGITADTEYTIRVRATTAVGDGEWSDAIMARHHAGRRHHAGCADHG